MKTFNIYFIVASMTLFLWSCEKYVKVRGPIPFQFEFTTYGGPIEGDMSCGEPPIFMIRQEGAGKKNLILGEFTFVGQFCNNLDTGEYGLHDYFAEEGLSAAFGYFMAENGDRLNISPVKGQILPSTKEGYDLMFQDPFMFEGGTGRFEGATGSGMTDSYVDLQEGRTDHVWTGTLILR
ncbi:hypothetical protein MWU78_20970 [Arenibacter sp. F26102]|uniref:hypothetical protein n=1 Tax=Arenibacter sp. F26102 TaxID=2926416 RepID=UPI001FF284EB|nr:hypothetical protein [Arenibacter sp. F26102]MCK0148132.1 hypothetical protein [Arenibacter sp. F26102]